MALSDPEGIQNLYHEDKAVTLLGTAHVSKESVQLVSRVILEEKPDTVCVELCQSRYQALRQKERWLEMDVIKVIKEKKAFLLLSNLLLASFQKKIARQFDIRPGEEMIKADGLLKIYLGDLQLISDHFHRQRRNLVIRSLNIQEDIHQPSAVTAILG